LRKIRLNGSSIWRIRNLMECSVKREGWRSMLRGYSGLVGSTKQIVQDGINRFTCAY
jgi:hypothetical protein